MAGPVVAVAGATGHLGQYISDALLSPEFQGKFKSVILLSRKPAAESEQLQKWEKAGAVIRVYSLDDLSSAFEGVDVVVSCVGTAGTGHDFKDKLVKVLDDPSSTVKLYIPSEFGVDHYVHDFAHPEWDKKKHHFSITSSMKGNKGLKVCRIFNGLFLEDSIGFWFGLDAKNGRYEAIGSADSPITFTSLSDVGKSVASIAAMTPSDVPDTIHLCGDNKTMREIKDIMRAAGGGDIELTVKDTEPFRSDAIRGSEQNDPAPALRFLMGEGKINHSSGGQGNDNEVVNPKESLWKWMTVKDHAKETNGRPWST